MTTAEAAGKRASAMVQYRYQNGELVEMKDDKGVTLWKLSSENPYGQPLVSHKGNVKETYTYDKGFPVSQLLQNEDKAIGALTWRFNTQKGLLDSRQYSFWGKQEDFSYDNLDRLTAWGDANTPPQTHSYDERGRITENSVIGTYEYTRNGYQQQKLTTNEAGETHLEKYPLPIVRYNAFKAPDQIYVKDKERISFEYDAFESRAAMYYGNTDPEKQKRRYVKHYNHDGTFEIKHDRTTGLTQFYIYLGGDAYTAPAVLSVTDDSEKYLYLHRDYLGSITLITDNAGNAVERRHFDAWGNITSYWNAEGKTTVPAEGILLDRGYTGHEHLLSVGLINMNARLYDPALHRFLQPDNYVQDPFNTQNFNRYGYVLNNPLLYTDPTGEEFFTLTTLAVIGLGTIISSAAASWDTIKDWIGRNAESTGQWFEKQGRSVGQWFSKQYNSVKEWFQERNTPMVNVKPITLPEGINPSQVYSTPRYLGEIRPPTQHYFLGMNMTEMSEGNWFEQFVYNFFNDLSMPVQMMMGRSVGSSFAPMRNLNGTSMTTNDALLGFVNSASMGYSIALRGMTIGVEMTRAAVPEASNMALRVVETPKFVPHSVMRQAERGITTDMVKTVL